MSLLKPVEEARKFYGENFKPMVEQFMLPSRYIYSGDDFFVLAYPHCSGLFRPDINKNVDKIDTWVIHYFSGDIGRLFEISPFDLEYTAFQRKNGKWKLYKTEDIKRRL